MRTAFLLLAVLGALALAGCGGDDSTEAVTTTETETSVADTAPEESTTTEAATTQAETTIAPKPRTIAIVVEQGRPRGGIRRPTIDKGEKVVLVIRADAGEEVHLHGYDLDRPVTPGKPVRLAFTAKLPGRFELELHHPDAVLAVLEVRP